MDHHIGTFLTKELTIGVGKIVENKLVVHPIAAYIYENFIPTKKYVLSIMRTFHVI